MIKLHTRLMYPEPGDTGSGNETADKTPPVETPPAEPTPQENKNPFDFGQFMDNNETDAENEEPTQEEETEYVLGFTEADGLDADDVAFFTNKAKELNLPAEGATEFVRAFGKMLMERDNASTAAAEKALRQEWGKDFDAKTKQVGAYMGRVFAALKMTREETMDFSTPAHFRVFAHLMKRSTEKAAVAAPAVMTAEQKSARLQELSRQKVRNRYSNNNEGAEKVIAEFDRLAEELYGHKISREQG